MEIAYGKVVEIRTMRSEKIRHPEYIDDAKNLIEKETGLRPTTDAMIRGIWNLDVPGRLKDHLWNMLLGKIKCGNYWKNMSPEHAPRQYCTACNAEGERETLEDEHHLWLDCQFNGQKEAWKTAKTIWRRTTKAKWPEISIGLIRGIGSFAMEDEPEKLKRNRDAERARILISTTVWTIWKARNQRAIQNIWTPASEPSKALRKTLSEYVTKSWNALQFKTSSKRKGKSERRLSELWGRHYQALFDAGTTATQSLEGGDT
jgi:hypothetical protein